MHLQQIQNKIYEIRGQQVMLDFDLARLYGVETRVLKQAVRRNSKRFPEDFMFQLTANDINYLVSSGESQIVIPTSYNFGGHLPFAFTEQGVAMLSSVLRSDKALEININIMRAFVSIRQYLLNSINLSRELESIKKDIRCLNHDITSLEKDQENYEEQLDDIYIALTQLAKKQGQTDKSRNSIGFVQRKENKPKT
jgi:hypothetical protein